MANGQSKLIHVCQILRGMNFWHYTHHLILIIMWEIKMNEDYQKHEIVSFIKGFAIGYFITDFIF